MNRKEKLDARFFRQNGRGLSVIWKNGIKTDEIQSFAQKNTKLWPDEIYLLYGAVPYHSTAEP